MGTWFKKGLQQLYPIEYNIGGSFALLWLERLILLNYPQLQSNKSINRLYKYYHLLLAQHRFPEGPLLTHCIGVCILPTFSTINPHLPCLALALLSFCAGGHQHPWPSHSANSSTVHSSLHSTLSNSNANNIAPGTVQAVCSVYAPYTQKTCSAHKSIISHFQASFYNKKNLLKIVQP